MPIYTVEGTEEAGFIDDIVPEIAQEFSSGALVSRETVEAEIDLILRTMRTFWELEPDQVMRMTSAISARLTEMAIHLHRLESNRQWRQIRTMQVHMALEECDRQYKTASRFLEVRRQELDLSKG